VGEAVAMRITAVAAGVTLVRVVADQVQIPAVINDLGDLGTFLLGMAAMGAIIVWAIKTFRREGRNGGAVQPHSVESLINIIAARVSEVQQGEWRAQAEWRGAIGQLLDDRTVKFKEVQDSLDKLNTGLVELLRRSDGLDQAIRQVKETSERVPWDGLERRQHPRS